MHAPLWLKPGVVGAIAGGALTMILGFSQGGWYLGSSAERLAQERSAAAVTEALVPVCLSQSQADPNRMAKLGELNAMTSSYGRRDFIMKTGWATMPSTEAPNRDVAMACAEAIADAEKA